MPTYEYACRDCGEHVEVVQSFRDDPLTTCGLCGGTLRKVFSAAGIVFKGSGYYVTDSRKPAPSSAAGSDGAGSDGASDGKKADTPAASGDAKKPSGDAPAKSGKPKTADKKSA